MFGLPSWVTWVLFGALWAAVLWRALRRSDEPLRLLLKWVATGLIAAGVFLVAAKMIGPGTEAGLVGGFGIAAVVVGSIAVGGILLGVVWASSFGERLARPLTSLFDDGGAELKPAPLYSTAIALRKQGRPAAALQEIDRQLTRFPNDPQGTLLRAEIEALELSDLAAAENTLGTWLASGSPDPGYHAIAHTKLADWHLLVGNSAQEARRHLQTILDSQPQSDAALFAEQRLAHLDFEAQPKASSLRVTTDSGKAIETGVPPPFTPPPASDEIPALLQHLQTHPHDIAARENLVQIYAWETRQPDQARVELEELIELQSDSPRAVVRCLHLLADVEIQLAGDLEAARASLQRIIQLFPGSAWAHQVEHRLRLLPREMARHHHARVVTGQAHPRNPA
jgi:tetratricopeptide (TPR) repeat protein